MLFWHKEGFINVSFTKPFSSFNSITMKANNILLILVLFCIGNQKAYAKAWRVNNNGFSADFATLDEANNSNLVSNGDTIHLEGSTIRYEACTVSKRLIIIGPGYFLNENAKTSVNLLPAEVVSITFSTGSAGSQLMGVWLSGSAAINVLVSNIVIRRCKVDYAIFLANGISNIVITQNYFDYQQSPAISALRWSNLGGASDVIFNNNICKRILRVEQDGNNIYSLAECRNNIFEPPSGTSSSIQPVLRMNVGAFENNILVTAGATVFINNGTNQNVRYNTGTDVSQFGNVNGNVVETNMNTLFVVAGTSDGRYQLQAGSAPGSDGTERGAFGGSVFSNRYMLSGLAPIPVIYGIITSGVADPSGLSVTIKARTIQ